jgi:hypothetical protein
MIDEVNRRVQYSGLLGGARFGSDEVDCLDNQAAIAPEGNMESGWYLWRGLLPLVGLRFYYSRRTSV